MDVLNDVELIETLAALIVVIEASGLQRVDGPQPTWERTVAHEGREEHDKVVLWQHPRRGDLHGYVGTTRHAQMVHLRLFDPDWRPARVLPGYLDKGWTVASVEALRTLGQSLAHTIWPRALLWLETPVDAETLMSQTGRVLSMIAPGPLLERHRQRAAWLESVGRTDEAEFVAGVVAEIEALFRGDGDA